MDQKKIQKTDGIQGTYQNFKQLQPICPTEQHVTFGQRYVNKYCLQPAYL